MRIEIITMWYNEEFLAPLFLRHYDFADAITLLYDMDTTDSSLDMVRADPRVTVQPFRFPDGMDDALKQVKVNERYRASGADWALLVDADEFLFWKREDTVVTDIRPLLETTGADIFTVQMLDVMRHRDDADIDRSLPPLMQRRHGFGRGVKPCVVRTGRDFYWRAGCHELVSTEQNTIVADTLFGAHWAMADPCFSIERRLKHRRARQSKYNLEKGLTSHNHHITLKDLQREFAEGQDAPCLISAHCQ